MSTIQEKAAGSRSIGSRTHAQLFRKALDSFTYCIRTENSDNMCTIAQRLQVQRGKLQIRKSGVRGSDFDLMTSSEESLKSRANPRPFEGLSVRNSSPNNHGRHTEMAASNTSLSSQIKPSQLSEAAQDFRGRFSFLLQLAPRPQRPIRML